MKYKHIVWDWNGTLLNDAEACMKAMSRILEKRNLGSISLKEYRAKLEYPAVNMYNHSGFDFEKESFDELSEEYIKNYIDQFDSIMLHDDAIKVLKNFQLMGLKQHIVSASGKQVLKEQVEIYGLSDYFISIFGQDNNKGESKVHLAKRLLSCLECNPKDILFIGDTAHDYEVASETGFDCRLVSNGHSSREKLEETGGLIYPNLTALYDSLYIK